VDAMSVVDDVREFLRTDLKVRQIDNVDPDDRLVDRGVIDSIELMQLTAFIEQKYGIVVDDPEVVPDNLGSLTAIDRFVQRKLGRR
jgi:acyl carrier protein